MVLLSDQKRKNETRPSCNLRYKGQVHDVEDDTICIFAKSKMFN